MNDFPDIYIWVVWFLTILFVFIGCTVSMRNHINKRHNEIREAQIRSEFYEEAKRKGFRVKFDKSKW